MYPITYVSKAAASRQAVPLDFDEKLMEILKDSVLTGGTED